MKYAQASGSLIPNLNLLQCWLINWKKKERVNKSSKCSQVEILTCTRFNVVNSIYSNLLLCSVLKCSWKWDFTTNKLCDLMICIIPFQSFPTQGTWDDSRQTGNFNFQRALTSPSGEYSDGRRLRFYPPQHTSGPFLRFGSYKTGRLIFWTDLEAHGVVQIIGGRCHWAPSQSLPETQQWPDVTITQQHRNTGVCRLHPGLGRDKSARRTMAFLHFSQWTRPQIVSSDKFRCSKGTSAVKQL